MFRDRADVIRAICAGISAAALVAIGIFFGSRHLRDFDVALVPYAGATTLIISPGIVTRPFHLLVIEIAVGILTLQAIAINRLAGIDYPLWALRRESP